jgi:hypothetical protein
MFSLRNTSYYFFKLLIDIFKVKDFLIILHSKISVFTFYTIITNLRELINIFLIQLSAATTFGVGSVSSKANLRMTQLKNFIIKNAMFCFGTQAMGGVFNHYTLSSLPGHRPGVRETVSGWWWVEVFFGCLFSPLSSFERSAPEPAGVCSAGGGKQAA